MMGSMMQDLAFAIPGVDEAMSFAEIMKYVIKIQIRLISFLLSASVGSPTEHIV
jgi:arsenite/tail-anchored protein-transporting ATPase